MTAHYESKHGLVSKGPEELYMAFCDLSNFARMAPAQYRDSIRADYDTLRITVQGFTIGVRIDDRVPYSRITIGSSESPVEFVANLHFDSAAVTGRTDFWVEIDANLNFMMKTLLGSKIQGGLDKFVDSLVNVSEGRMPESPENFA